MAHVIADATPTERGRLQALDDNERREMVRTYDEIRLGPSEPDEIIGGEVWRKGRRSAFAYEESIEKEFMVRFVHPSIPPMPLEAMKEMTAIAECCATLAQYKAETRRPVVIASSSLASSLSQMLTGDSNEWGKPLCEEIRAEARRGYVAEAGIRPPDGPDTSPVSLHTTPNRHGVGDARDAEAGSRTSVAGRRVLMSCSDGAPLLDMTRTGDEDLSEVWHSPDFRTVCWHGNTYTFTGMQAAVVKVLWETSQGGTPDVGVAYLLESAGSDSKRMVDLFRGHSAWNTMIVQGQRKGAKRLAAPTPFQKN